MKNEINYIKTNEIIITLFLALGVEKIFKHMLQNINPSYIYKDTSFKNCAPIIYKQKMIKLNSEEISKTPDADTITLRTAVFRLKLFSNTIEKHSNMLLSLSSYRDVIAHCTFDELDLNKLVKINRCEMYFFLSELQDETNLDLKDSDRLITLTANELKNEYELDDRMNTLIEKHKNIINEKIAKKQINRDKLPLIAVGGNRVTYPCPICGNDSVVDFEPEFDYSDGESWFVGLYPTQLKCSFCELELNNYDELDYFDIEISDENIVD